MRPSLPLALLAGATLLGAVEVRKSAEEYPSHTSVSDMKVGVEYMVTAFSAEGQTFTVDDHLILEVGIFPREESKVDLRRFILRINGKRELFAQTPGMVAASVKYPDWTRKPTLQAAAGPLIIGRPTTPGRFPGDQRAPLPPRQPVENESPKEQIDYSDLINKSALPEGVKSKPLAGLIYFPYDGKLKSIRTVELLIDDTVLKLR
jgi:hypothetical protein